ncbi:MAG: hypothetical protein PUP46_06335 [Endozoicomonas sp. (ex Botrylloides leachii)]|nr:hypothetical protein [Endozoicomonas sp. (ex Botrylloides leachii)]
MKGFLIFPTLCLISVVTQAEYIDDYSKNLYELIKKEIALNCEDSKGYRCASKVREDIYKNKPRRGTKEYAEKNYKMLNPSSADKKIRELFAISEEADAGLKIDKPGEIVYRQIKYEAAWIQKNIYKRRFYGWAFTLSTGERLYPKI